MYVKKYISCMRIPHYIKNLIVFFPVFFNKSLMNVELILLCFKEFIGFCVLSSAIYVINDIQDIDHDRKHDRKKNRPIAAGEISIPRAYCFAIILIMFSVILFCQTYVSWRSCIWPILYFVINIGYSYGGKHIPVLDIILLGAGYPIRLMYGGIICEISISSWLFLTVICLSFYFAIGKRRGEWKLTENITRPVLQYYSKSWLDEELHLMLGLSIMFYSLWAVEKSEKMAYTVPLVLTICIYYDLLIYSRTDGDPINTLLKSRILIILLLAYAVIIMGMIYL